LQRPGVAEVALLEAEELPKAATGQVEQGEELFLGERSPLAGALDLDELPGSMRYSAVIQPWPLPSSQSGTRGSTLAVQRTVVRPA
jgi:hypothetical protein